ncbi:MULTISPECIES: ATP-binding cassette domain-containing protein [unclassified Oceanispirochaeta]|uniref:ATP-binding cassette domain-containing protein n=1 Tax=unclassified Oceanispirochaeta TaxID=2635722 RepID=UPI000E09DB5A|nr:MULTISPECIES: ATP-binding cassette domain-containing protein [unclassified Oceanispirochaeta]MBF9014981.1 ATP-binding cassette domain-containing protein [Oceanispirochaeta sp. M2]NPD71338.1 ATP-binding cassette domain-containing protein [Oceanispirochaeta sp. M1]RDG33304.1 ATP-binding cassette domain-containing protein [Oceanispirochaeta sp. M1]
MIHKDKSLTIKEVAQFLNISNQMVYNLIRDKKIEAFKIGSAIRILSSDLYAYIERQKELFHSPEESIENSDENIFLVKNICFRREQFQLENISFEIPRGKILSVIGPSGSGKTMLLKSLAGLNKPEKGAIFLGSNRLDTISPRERNIGFVFEDYALMPNRKGRGNIRFPLEMIKKLRKEDIDPAVTALAEELNLSDENLDTIISELPEGVKQMIAIAKADIRNIDLLIMDEPLARLDAMVRLQMRSFLKELVIKLGKTTIISLHDPETALAMSDYIAVLDKGRLVQFGSAQEVYKHPVSKIVFEMTSRYAINEVDIKVKDKKTYPFELETEKEDGDYRLIFRADELKISDRGMKLSINRKHILDGNRILAECSSENDDLELVLPSETEDEFRFLPTSFGLFYPENS